MTGTDDDKKFELLMRWLEKRTADVQTKVVNREDLKDVRCEMGPALTEEQFKAYCERMGDKAPKIIKSFPPQK